MFAMKVVVCDDDLAFCKILSQKIEEQFAIRDWPYSCGVFSNGQELLNADLSDVQIVFLDIDMPGINGVETARQLRVKYTELIIVFVTAFPEYAVEGYSVEALRYLLKDSLSEQLPVCLDAAGNKLFAKQQYMKIQTANRLMIVRLDELLYFEGTAHHRVILHTHADKSLECLGQLGEYEKQLADKDFLRIQKSYLVNMWHIEDIRNYTAMISNGDILRVSRQAYREICKKYVMWKGQKI